MWLSCNLNNWGEQLKVLCLFLLLPSSEVKMKIIFLNVSGLCLTKPTLSEGSSVKPREWVQCVELGESFHQGWDLVVRGSLSLLYSTIASRTLPATFMLLHPQWHRHYTSVCAARGSLTDDVHFCVLTGGSTQRNNLTVFIIRGKQNELFCIVVFKIPKLCQKQKQNH